MIGMTHSQGVFPWMFLVAAVGLCACGPTRADDEKLSLSELPTDIKPGQTGLLKSEKGMHYFLRVPENYDSENGARAIVFMHGSNMKGLDYLRSFEAAGWCEDDILICPNGERGDDPYGRNNFTFGSAPFVAGVTAEVTEAFTTTRVYIGGHSQGGYLTYSVMMHYPDLFHGAFPMAAGCWLQNEPQLWEGAPKKMDRQKQIAIAVIHGQADPVVPYSLGEYSYNIYLAMGYPRLRLLAPERLRHQFMLSPVPEALDWLDAMTGLQAAESMRLAQQFVNEQEWGWAHQAAHAVLDRDDAPEELTESAQGIVRRVETAAEESVEAIEKQMQSEPALTWLPPWYEFRRQFGATDAAAELVAEFDRFRAEQRKIGRALSLKARAHFRKKERDEAYAIAEEILEKTPYSFYAYRAVRWLQRREKQ